MSVGIVGAGLAGLAIAEFLKDAVIFESSNKPGGLLKSEVIDGYTFDIGGSHIIFSRNENVLSRMLGWIGRYVEHRRRTYIYYDGKFVKYPFENGIYVLSKEERFKILKDFVENLLRDKEEPKNLLDWFYYVFGKEITERYLRPYNEKIWKRDLEEISLEWVGGRIPNPPVEDVLKSAVGIETEGYTHQLRFFYPLKGGIENLARNLSRGKKIRTSERVRKIYPEEKIYVETEKGDYEFEKLVFTAPLTLLPELGFKIREVDMLDYNSLTVVGLGVRGKVPNYHWLYFPQKEIIFHRIAFLSNYSPYMAPKGGSVVIAEISTRRGERVKNACEKVLEDLREVGFEFEVEVCESWFWEHAYVVYNHSYREAVEKIRQYLLERKIIPFGRFGGWEYLNMDEVVAKAEAVAKEI